MSQNDKQLTIGIPRALFYYKFSVFWPTFFEKLGCRVIISSETNKKILTRGCQISEAESCLSFKIFQGHIDDLLSRSDIDYIFSPRIVSLRKQHQSCPKFFGIPDLVNLLSMDQRILAPDIDYNKESLTKTILKIGRELGQGKSQIKEAYQAAFRAEKEHWHKKASQYQQAIKSKDRKVVLIGHPYNLYDDYVNLQIAKKLTKSGVLPLTIDSVPYDFETTFTHWDFASELLNQIKVVAQQDITGAVMISTFNCGCDSILKEFIAQEFKEKKIPFLGLTIDEHTGEAGMVTRLEAFIDTLK